MHKPYEKSYPVIGKVHNIGGLLFVFLASFSMATVFNYLYPLLGILLKKQGFEDEKISFLFSIAEFGELILMLTLPIYIQRFSMRKILAGVMIIQSVVLIGLYSINSAIYLYYPLVFLSNFTFYFILITSTLTANKWADGKRRGALLALSTSLIWAGGITGSLILEHMPHTPSLFLMGAFVLLTIGLVQLADPYLKKLYLMSRAPQNDRPKHQKTSYWEHLINMKNVLPLITISVILIFIVKVLIKGILDFTTILDTQKHLQNMAPEQITSMFSGALLLSFLLGYLFDKFNHFSVLSFTFIGMLLASICLEFYFMDALLLQTLCYAALGAGIFSAYAIAQKILGETLQGKDLALGATSLGLVGAIVSIFSPSFFGFWLTTEGTSGFFKPFIAASTLGLVAALLKLKKEKKEA